MIVSFHIGCNQGQSLQQSTNMSMLSNNLLYELFNQFKIEVLSAKKMQKFPLERQDNRKVEVKLRYNRLS
jgi:hypothetical protein